MEILKKRVGEKIRKARKAAGYSTQEALAKVIGVDRTRVSRWESGAELPDRAYRSALLSTLKINEASLFDPEPSPPPQPPTAAALAQAVVEQQREIEELRAELERLKPIEPHAPPDMSPDEKKLFIALRRANDPDLLAQIIKRVVMFDGAGNKRKGRSEG